MRLIRECGRRTDTTPWHVPRFAVESRGKKRSQSINLQEQVSQELWYTFDKARFIQLYNNISPLAHHSRSGNTTNIMLNFINNNNVQ